MLYLKNKNKIITMRILLISNFILRACPECRVTSNFVCPSMYWVDGKEEKDQLINDYRLALR